MKMKDKKQTIKIGLHTLTNYVDSALAETLLAINTHSPDLAKHIVDLYVEANLKRDEGVYGGCRTEGKTEKEIARDIEECRQFYSEILFKFKSGRDAFNKIEGISKTDKQKADRESAEEYGLCIFPEAYKQCLFVADAPIQGERFNLEIDTFPIYAIRTDGVANQNYDLVLIDQSDISYYDEQRSVRDLEKRGVAMRDWDSFGYCWARSPSKKVLNAIDEIAKKKSAEDKK